MPGSFHLIDEIVVANSLGEGIQWRECDASVWWTDILSRRLYRYDWSNKRTHVVNVPEPLGSFAFTSVDDIILGAFASGFAWFNLSNGAIRWLERPEFLDGEGRFNDGRVDRQGRFWAGTMMAEPGGKYAPSGRLFSIDGYQKTSQHEGQLSISNGLCWSPDGGTLYFADSLPGIIYQYDFLATQGTISNRREFARSPEGGSPDGAITDALGNIWSAQWGIGKVLVYSPTGEVVEEIPVPVSQPTCVAFGGKDLNLLFVTTARDGLSEATLANEPSAGNVFVYKTDYRGLPEMTYAGKQKPEQQTEAD